MSKDEPLCFYLKLLYSSRVLSLVAQVLTEFYVSLRKKHGSEDSTPITLRQIEGMVRLCEVREAPAKRSAIARALLLCYPQKGLLRFSLSVSPRNPAQRWFTLRILSAT